MEKRENPDISLFTQREEEIYHAPYERELSFYEMVKNGDGNAVQQWLSQRPIGSVDGMGQLSDNPLRHLRYHVIISIAMITRFCIEGGMDPETAYGLSDVYIRQSDLVTQWDDLVSLHRKMCMDYTRRMSRLKKERIYSRHIVRCIDYIYAHIQEKITVEMLAGECGLHENYLSRLFKKETGVGIGDYIRSLRVETSKNMLKYSDYSLTEIAGRLAFSSQSHFVKIFHEQTGMTPKEYRNRYYRTNWGEGSNATGQKSADKVDCSDRTAKREGSREE